MRRIAVPLALLAVVALATVAFAQDQVLNTYTVSGAVTPAKAGSKKKPKRVQVVFNYTVDTSDQNVQPSAINRYKISIYGVRSINGKRFKKCTAEQIVNAGGVDDECPKGALMGDGEINAVVYPSDDPRSTSTIPCEQLFNYYNAGNRKATLYLYPDPSADPNSNCGGVKQVPPIPVDIVKGEGGGTALQFDVAPNVLHPVPGLTTAVRSVKSTILAKSIRKKGKRYNHYESVKCQGDGRSLEVTFTTEAGQTETKETQLPC
jgi:hypothetical protein